MTTALIISTIILMVLFIPNNNERHSPFVKFMNYLGSKNLLKTAKEMEGNKEFILELVNNHVDRYNKRSLDIGDEDLKENVTEIDPYSKYIFHGACLGCPIPFLESISGCSACSHAVGNIGSDRSEVSEEMREAGIEAQNMRLEETAKAHKGDIPFILEMVNKAIDDRNDFLDREEPHLTDIDPYSHFIFHGGCHDCKNPFEESISGCYSCKYYNCWEGFDKSTKEK